MDQLLSLHQKKTRLVLGLMSGTSLDGVDLALCRISGTGAKAHIQLEAFETLEIPSEIRIRIREAFHGTTEEICRLHFDLGRFFAGRIQDFLRQLGNPAVDLIGSHGQTLWHCHGHSSLQLGDGDVIAQTLGIVTISDFRAADIAQGGCGAPLVPYLDRLLFAKPGQAIALQNLGGMGNVTLLPSSLKNPILAFDTGPCNGILNEITERLTMGLKAYDEGGKLAQKGEILPELLEEWLQHPYFSQKPPKSTGREDFGKSWVEQIFKQYGHQKGESLLRTATRLVATSIAQAYAQFLPEVDQVFLSGGGLHNPILLADLKELVGAHKIQPLPLHPSITGDSKEAVAFALFAHERINGAPTNLMEVTGARRAVSLGKISIP